MPFMPAILTALILSSSTQIIGQEPGSDAIPVRLAWTAMNADGFSQVTLTNEGPLAVTAWALKVSITRQDGRTETRPSFTTDGLGAFASGKLGSPLAGAGTVLLPGKTLLHSTKLVPSAADLAAVSLPPNARMVSTVSAADVAAFSLTLDAVVFEDGTVAGNRSAIARVLAQRETWASACEPWLQGFQAAARASDPEAGAAILQDLIEKAAASGMAFTLKGMAERAVASRADAKAFQASVERGTRTAEVYVTECRRHVK